MAAILQLPEKLQPEIAQFLGGATLIESVTGLPYWLALVIFAFVVILYTAFGGFTAVVITDTFQGIIMLVGIVAVIGAVLKGQGGLMEAMKGLAEVSDPAVSDVPGVFNSFLGPDPINLLGVVLLTSLGTWGLPQMVQKFYAIKSEKAINKGMVISTVFALVVAGGCYFLGGFGRLFSDRIDLANGGFDSIIPTMLSDLSPFLIAVVVILVLSASMSTLSSLVMASSSTLTLDFIKGTVVKDLSEKKQLLIMRVLIAVFIAISAVIAIVQHKSNVTFIAQLMGISWGALAGAFLAPFLYGLYWKKATVGSVWCSFIFSTVVMLLNMVAKPLFPALLQSPINAGVACMLAGLVIVPAVSFVTKAPAAEHVDHVFSCYDKKVVVSVTDAIGEPISKEEKE